MQLGPTHLSVKVTHYLV